MLFAIVRRNDGKPAPAPVAGPGLSSPGDRHYDAPDADCTIGRTANGTDACRKDIYGPLPSLVNERSPPAMALRHTFLPEKDGRATWNVSLFETARRCRRSPYEGNAKRHDVSPPRHSRCDQLKRCVTGAKSSPRLSAPRAPCAISRSCRGMVRAQQFNQVRYIARIRRLAARESSVE